MPVEEFVPTVAVLAHRARHDLPGVRDLLIQHGARAADIEHVAKRIESSEIGCFGPMSWTAWGRSVALER
jgi:hypothetical protein